MIVGANPLIEVIPGLMVWTLLAFAICLFVLKKYAFGPVQKGIDARRDHIRASIDEADNAREEARALLAEHKKLIADAKTEAEGILAESRKAAAVQHERMREETEEDRKRRIEETGRQIDAATQQALSELRQSVATLSVEAAERITGKSLTSDDQKRLIDEALSEIDFSQLEANRS